ncbi:hypothetical protein [Streptomyces sp. Ru62]|uniref:hypothetical protein n=1 Tax=Streptomyces sp. Ru62 TaxID=2080745 RepID=UPI0011B0B95D|nr:hypothetical protein [Streptomyces sp. Ru62]
MPASEFETLPLGAVADTVTGKQDFELLAGLPDTFPDEHDEIAVKVLRLYAYKGGKTSLQLLRLSTEVRHTLTSSTPARRCPHPPAETSSAKRTRPTCRGEHGDDPIRVVDAGNAT